MVASSMARLQAHERIERDPAVMVGKPVIKGTRITVEHILRDAAHGMTPEEIARAYLRLTVDDVVAALTYDGEVAAPKAPELGSEDDAIREGLADLDAGRAINHRELSDWLATWGLSDPAPAPSHWFK